MARILRSSDIQTGETIHLLYACELSGRIGRHHRIGCQCGVFKIHFRVGVSLTWPIITITLLVSDESSKCSCQNGRASDETSPLAIKEYHTMQCGFQTVPDKTVLPTACKPMFSDSTR